MGTAYTRHAKLIEIESGEFLTEEGGEEEEEPGESLLDEFSEDTIDIADLFKYEYYLFDDSDDGDCIPLK